MKRIYLVITVFVIAGITIVVLEPPPNTVTQTDTNSMSQSEILKREAAFFKQAADALRKEKNSAQ